jgi:hypothetical protein
MPQKTRAGGQKILEVMMARKIFFLEKDGYQYHLLTSK